MIHIVITLLILTTAAMYWSNIVDGNVSIAPIIGLMFGCLYSYQQLEEETEYTLQFCLFIVSITVEWKSTNGLKK